MLSYGKQTIDEDDIKAVIKVLRSDWLTQGPMVSKFEKALGEYFGTKYCNVVSNGTAALHLVGLSLGWKKGDIVITTPLSFVATANCIVYAGATPDFVDIDANSYTIDVEKLEEKLAFYSKRGQTVKAVIGVDYAGHPCDWKGLRKLADEYHFTLVNDNCHGMGSRIDNQKDYACKYADIATQSYHPVKHITTGEGGAVLTNDEKIAKKINTLRSHGIVKSNSNNSSLEGPWHYEMQNLGYNYRITDFQCALGLNQLKKLDTFVESRRLVAEKYNLKLNNLPFIKIPEVKSTVFHSYHLYPLQIDFKKLSISKKQFFLNSLESGVSFQVHYIPIHTQPFYSKKFNFQRNDFPNSIDFYEREVSLPIFPTLESEQIDKVLEILTSLNGKLQ